MWFYKYLFIFALFSIVGWIIELIYRSIRSHKLINPGFMIGCVVPLYGVGTIILNLISILISKISFEYKIIFIFFMSIVLLTLLELICGFIFLKFFHIRLWDYRNNKMNFKGFICVRFAFIWGILGTFYYLCIYPNINNISNKVINSNFGIFSLGIFLGIFLIDLSLSVNLFNRLIKYAEDVKQNINVEKIKLEVSLNITKKKFLNAINPYTLLNKYIKDKTNDKSQK